MNKQILFFFLQIIKILTNLSHKTLSDSQNPNYKTTRVFFISFDPNSAIQIKLSRNLYLQAI